MAALMGYSFYFAEPWWLPACLLVVPIVWLALRSLAALGRLRLVLAVTLRCAVVIILVVLLARPMLSRTNERLTLIAVVDRSQSIPPRLQQAGIAYLRQALRSKDPLERLAVVDVAEIANISKLPSGDPEVYERNLTLRGDQSRLADGLQMAMAIAPPDTGARIVLISEGNQTAGDLKEAARLAAANKIPVDVLPIYYNYDREVIFKRLAAPARARSNETVSLRFILNSTSDARGRLLLNLNDAPVDLAPSSEEIGVPVELERGTNVKTVSVPLGTRGIHQFEAVFIPDDPNQDKISKNNQSTAITYVAGPGHILVVDADGSTGQILAQLLQEAELAVRHIAVADFPDNLVNFMDVDAVVLVNTEVSSFTYEQQEMLTHYVQDLGGGLIMVGGPQAFGAGGWIGSPAAQVLPVDLDPPQKKQLPKGALVLIMHACEMPQGNYWGKKVALAAVQTLSRLDLAGILAYDWQGQNDWIYSLSEVDDKKAITAAINNMVMGDMPSLQDHLQKAYNKLKDCDAAQKHVIVISDGDPQPPTTQLLNQCRQAQITVTGVAIFPHSPADKQNLLRVARLTGGRYYDVSDPQKLPQIFVKEAQVVRRSMIIEETFSPSPAFSLSETIRGLRFPLPNLDGYVLTGPKGGLAQVVLASSQGDPILATCQAGLGRCAAFTSSIDSRWAADWLGWPGFERFWEQTVRWAAKPAQSSDCEVFTDVQGRDVTVSVEALDSEGNYLQFADIEGQIVSPDVSTRRLELTQIGPGQYRGCFQANTSGSYVINLRYRRPGEGENTRLTQATVTVPFAPEFRDLSDNAPLLKEISELSNGRVLDADPNQAELFDYEGVKLPLTHLPLTKPLMLIWLALFLLDVAARRIAIDFKAAFRRFLAFATSFGGKQRTEKTINQLKLARQKARDQLAARSASATASRRYRGAEKYSGEVTLAEPEQKTERRVEKPPAVKEPPAEESKVEPSHIDKLLKAKRKAADRRRAGGTENHK